MIRVKPFHQTAGFCGPASLKMVMDYYGISVSEKAIAQAAGASRKEGASKEGLIKAARHFRFKVFSQEKSDLGDLRRFIKRGMPVIVDWFFEDDGHYSVAVDIDQKEITLIDPSLGGARKMSLERFTRLWFDFPRKSIKEPKDLVLRLMIVVTPIEI